MCERKYPHIIVRNSIKNEIVDRIRGTTSLMAQSKYYMTDECESLEEAFCNAVYDNKCLEDKRLDNGTSDIDSLDSFEYSWEKYLKSYVRRVR